MTDELAAELVSDVTKGLREQSAWSPREGLPEYSAEFEGEDRFAISVSITNNIEVSLHHPDGYRTGKDGYALNNVVAADVFCKGHRALARDRVEQFARHCDRLLAALRKSRVQTYQFDVVAESAAMSSADSHAHLAFLAPSDDCECSDTPRRLLDVLEAEYLHGEYAYLRPDEVGTRQPFGTATYDTHAEEMVDFSPARDE